MTRFRKPTTIDERLYEKEYTLKEKEGYLSRDIMRRIGVDGGFRDRVRYIERALGDTRGWVLEIGSNTCAECEYLAVRGHSVIATDINELALAVSQERCAKFGRKSPHYLACDGHHLPLEKESVRFVMFNESLHHMENPLQVLREVERVLAPATKVFINEPNALDPYRRLSELRDLYFRGSIERSFSVAQLNRLLIHASLHPISTQVHAFPHSVWMKNISSFRLFLKDMYFRVSRAMPCVFGNVIALAEKQGEPIPVTPADSFESILRCPATGSRVVRVSDGCHTGFVSLSEDFRGLYPIYHGIPVLIREDAQQIDRATWHALVESSSRSEAEIV